MPAVPVFFLTPTDETRERVVECKCGDPECAIDGSIAHDTLFRRSDSGELTTLRDAPVGAMWDADWFDGDARFTGPDGIALVVRTPGGTWTVDGEASNCTRPGDVAHKCWVRHGDPRDPQGERTGVKLHVDKNGETCAAGAGSIACGGYHGFLHHGALTDC